MRIEGTGAVRGDIVFTGFDPIGAIGFPSEEVPRVCNGFWTWSRKLLC